MVEKRRQEEDEGWRGEGAGAGMWVIDCSPVPDKAECGRGRQLGNPGEERGRELQPGRFPPPASHLALLDNLKSLCPRQSGSRLMMCYSSRSVGRAAPPLPTCDHSTQHYTDTAYSFSLICWLTHSKEGGCSIPIMPILILKY